MVHPMDRIQWSKVRGVVYKIPYGDYNTSYIGQTGRTLEHRVKELKGAYASANSFNSAVAEHSLEQGHRIGWDDLEVITVRQRMYQRSHGTSGRTMNRENRLLL